MADRYWVGGTASWDGTAGTKWATTSGGAGGASVPTAADDVFFDANSGTGTVSIATGNTGAKSINCTGFTGTLGGSAAISVAGSVTLVNAMGFTYTGGLTITGSGTLTSAGKTFSGGGITINGTGITVGLGDAVSTAFNLVVTAGTFNTNNFNVTAAALASSNSNTRTINLGSSIVNLSAGGGTIDFATSTNLTFNAGTSQINLTAGNATLNGGGGTFNNVAFTSTNSTNTRNIIGANTFNNLSVTAPASAGVAQIAFNNNQVINGTLSTTGTAGNRRVWFRSDTYGVRRTLTVNSAPSLTDADFRDIIVNGTAAPISGTRIGNRGACAGITFSAPKTVYRVGSSLAWTSNSWSDTSGGTANTNFFPLPQDTAIINNSTSGNFIDLDSTTPFLSSVDMSSRTNATTFAITSGSFSCYGSFKNGSGTSFSGTGTIVFSGEGTKTITSAGKTFSGGINIDAYGGTVELADALVIGGTNDLTFTNGSFNTKDFNLTVANQILIFDGFYAANFGTSTLTLQGSGTALNILATTVTVTGNCQINCTGSGATVNLNSVPIYNLAFTSASVGTRSLNGGTTLNNLSLTASATGLTQLSINSNITVNGTLTVAGSSATQRAFVVSSTLGTTRTITANAISANDCDFRDITIAGSAAGASPTRAGDCGGNSGINFPAPKTVYWNLSGVQNWSATAWATSSGGTPDVNNFPLAQDTAVVDDVGAASTISVNASWNIGTFNSSARTSIVTFSIGAAATFYGDFLFGSGVATSTGPSVVTFAKRGTQTITSNGRTFGHSITVDSFSGTVQLADALTIDAARTLTLVSGTFDAVTYNVTTGLFSISSTSVRTLRMGSGLWTLTGTGTVWNAGSTSNLTFLKGTANILLSDTSTSARTFQGGGLAYNKLTIGGATGTSTTTIQSSNQFTELASTKTVAHTIAFGNTTQTFGKWTVTGSAGNVVTITATSTSHVLAGSATSGIDYLAMGSMGFAATSAEFYAGANSTGTAGAPVFRTATPTPRTLYWVGGTGNWSDTARWSLSSGGAGGQAVPTSLDNVIFNSASNATAYTATIDLVSSACAKCNQLTISGPASGNVTLAGNQTIIIFGNVTLPATGLTRTYTGPINLSGSTTGKTFTTNGVQLSSSITVNGVGCEWTLGSDLNLTFGSFVIQNGSFSLNTYNLTCGNLSCVFGINPGTDRTLNLGSGTVSLSTAATNTIDFGLTEPERANLVFNAGTSQINLTASGSGIAGNNQVFNNVSFTSTTSGIRTINGSNTFNSLTLTASATGLSQYQFGGNQTITGTLTCSGSSAIARGFVRSNTIGTTRTLTVGTLAANDCDFRDITIAGTAAGTAPTRAGDCGGNSGITFPAPKTVYWNLAGTQAWSAIGWASSSGATPSLNNFPLAQDTAVIDNAGAAGQINVTPFNIGTLNASARTSALTLNYNDISTFYGSYTLGSGINIVGTSAQTFSGRGTMTFTSAGKTITFQITVDTPTGTFQLGDAFLSNNTNSGAVTLTRGTFDAVSYSVTQSGGFRSNVSSVRTLNMGSGLWTLTGTGTVWNLLFTNLTFNKGTANILLSDTSTSARTFIGGGLSYNKLTIGGATGISTTTITENNTFTEIASTKTVAHTIALGSTTQRVGAFTVTGTVGNVVTITGNTSNLIYTGSGAITGLDYLNVQGRVYGSAGQITDVWYAGPNSVNSGSLGWVFAAGVTPPPSANSNFFLMFG